MQGSLLSDCVTAPEGLSTNSAKFGIVYPAQRDRDHSMADLDTLTFLAALRRPRKVLELGTGRGVVTRNLLLNAPQASIHTVGSAPAGPVSDPLRYRGEPDAERVHQYWGTPPLYQWERVGRGVDFLLVNVPLSYEDARSMLATILPITARPEMYIWRLPEPVRRDCLPSTREGIGRLLAEMADLGVRLVEGTSLVVLPLARENRAKLGARLGVRIAEL